VQGHYDDDADLGAYLGSKISGYVIGKYFILPNGNSDCMDLAFCYDTLVSSDPFFIVI
jgi:hypothetical protein